MTQPSDSDREPSGRLVLCAHGTRSPTGRSAVSALVADVARRTAVPVVDAYVDVHGPALGSVLAAGDVVAPLLLSRGHHTEVDIGQLARGFSRVRVTPPLGPSTALVSVLHQRMAAAGLRPTDEVVLAAAGSSRPEAADAVRAVAEDLSCVARRTVRPSYVAAPEDSPLPSVVQAVARARAGGRRVLVAPYLLAPGAFLERVRSCGADVVARPLLHPDRVDPVVTDLVLARAAQVWGATRGSDLVTTHVAC